MAKNETQGRNGLAYNGLGMYGAWSAVRSGATPQPSARLRGLGLLVRTAVLLLFGALATFAVAQLQPGSPWAKFHANNLNNGVGIGSGATGAVKWSFGSNMYVHSSAAISANGTVYFGADGSDGNSGKVYALNGATGAVIWSFTAGNTVDSSPAIGKDGTVYIGSIDHKVYALDGATGAKKWSFTTGGGVFSSPAIGPDGTIYIASYDGNLYALNGATGAELWSFATTIDDESSPAIGSNGVLYVASFNDLVALDSTTGAEMWSFNAGSDVSTSPAIGPDGTVYFGTFGTQFFGPNGAVFALNGTTGAQIWSFTIGGQVGSSIQSSPAIGPDGTVYIGTSEEDIDGNPTASHVYALDGASGSEKWSFLAANAVFSSPAIASDGTVYACSYDSDSSGSPVDGRLYALNGMTGAEDWSFVMGLQIYSSPAIGSDGSLYVGVNPNGGPAFYVLSAAAILNFSVSPSTITSGATASGDVNLTEGAGPTGSVVSLSSGSADVQVPATVTVPSGYKGAAFKVTSSPVVSTETVTLTATYGSSSMQTAVTLSPSIALSALSVTPSTIVSGSSASGSVSLSTNAGTTGAVVSLASSTADVQVPASITVPSGFKGANFSVATASVGVQETVSITATLGSSTLQTTVTLPPTISLLNFSVSPTSVVGGTNVTGDINLTKHAGPSGVVVSLSSSSSDVQVPPMIAVAAGYQGATFAIETACVNRTENVTLTATLGTSSVQTVLTLTPNAVSDFSVFPSSVLGGCDAAGYIKLRSNAGFRGEQILLSSNTPDAKVPSSVTVSWGHRDAFFTITTSGVGSAINVTLTATLGSYSKQTVLTLEPSILSFSVSPSSVEGGSNVSGDLNLAGHTGASGQVVSLSSSSPSVQVPASITVPPGYQGVQFKITSSAVTVKTVVKIKAALGNSFQVVTLTLTP